MRSIHTVITLISCLVLVLASWPSHHDAAGLAMADAPVAACTIVAEDEPHADDAQSQDMPTLQLPKIVFRSDVTPFPHAHLTAFAIFRPPIV